MAAGLLLTGGSSRRMGSDKATWRRDGETLAARSGRVLGAVCAPVLEIGPGISGLDAVTEDPPGSGPLVACVGGWSAMTARGVEVESVVVLAVDLPNATESVLRHLATHRARAGAAAVVPRLAGRAQPLCARYDASAFEVAGRLVGAGERAMHAWLDALDVEYLDDAVWAEFGGPAVFADVDTPADAAAARLEGPR